MHLRLVNILQEQSNASSAQIYNLAKLGGSESVDRKARLADESDVLQRPSHFDLIQSNRSAQRFYRRKIHRAPLPFLRSRIGIGPANNFSYTDNGFVSDAVIEENLIADMHTAEIVSCREIADTGPASFLFFDQIAPGIGIWFGFHEPVVFHSAFMSSRAKSKDPDAKP